MNDEKSRPIIRFCPECESEGPHTVESRLVSIEFEGKNYRVTEEFVRCGSCGAEFDVPGLRDPLKSLYDHYRSEQGYPSAGEIKGLREKMCLTLEEFARLLATSKTTVRLYENGALPSEDHARQLARLIRCHQGLDKGYVALLRMRRSTAGTGDTDAAARRREALGVTRGWRQPDRGDSDIFPEAA